MMENISEESILEVMNEIEKEIFLLEYKGRIDLGDIEDSQKVSEIYIPIVQKYLTTRGSLDDEGHLYIGSAFISHTLLEMYGKEIVGIDLQNDLDRAIKYVQNGKDIDSNYLEILTRIEYAMKKLPKYKALKYMYKELVEYKDSKKVI